MGNALSPNDLKSFGFHFPICSRYFRSLAFALSGDFDKSCEDYTYLTKSDCGMEYPYFIFFSLSVLKDETEKAIHRYSKIRQYSPKLMDFEEDVFNLLPIKNNQILNQSIKLLDYSLGITRKNRN